MSRNVQVYVLATTINIFIFLMMYIFSPQLRGTLLNEDAFIENLTVVLFFGSFLLSLILIAKLEGKSYRRAYLVIPLICFIGFLDELSFGERIFNIKMPVIYGEKIDSVHDFASVAYRGIENNWNWFLFISVLVASSIAILLVILKYHKYFHRIPDIFKRYPLFRFVLISVGFMFIAALMDLEIISIGGHGRFSVFIEELCEMNAALALLFASFSIAHKKPSEIRSVLGS